MHHMINYIKDKDVGKFTKNIRAKQIVHTSWAFDDLVKLLEISDPTQLYDYLRSNNFVVNCFRYIKSRNRIVFTKENFSYFVFLFEIKETFFKNKLIDLLNEKERIFGEEFVDYYLTYDDRVFIRVQLSMNSSHDRANCEFISKLFGVDWIRLESEFDK